MEILFQRAHANDLKTIILCRNKAFITDEFMAGNVKLVLFEKNL